jgi:hypothetical protein
MKRIILGLTFFFSFLLPIKGAGILQKLTGGLHGSIFKDIPHPVYFSLQMLATYLIPFIFTLLFCKYINLKHRLPTSPPSKNIFIVGAIIIVIPQLLRLWTSTIQGGGASFALMSYAAPFILFAKLLIFIGAIRLFMSIKPSEKYEFTEN